MEASKANISKVHVAVNSLSSRFLPFRMYAWLCFKAASYRSSVRGSFDQFLVQSARYDALVDCVFSVKYGPFLGKKTKTKTTTNKNEDVGLVLARRRIRGRGGGDI